jgi:hypothetical protein
LHDQFCSCLKYIQYAKAFPSTTMVLHPGKDLRSCCFPTSCTFDRICVINPRTPITSRCAYQLTHIYIAAVTTLYSIGIIITYININTTNKNKNDFSVFVPTTHTHTHAHRHEEHTHTVFQEPFPRNSSSSFQK